MEFNPQRIIERLIKAFEEYPYCFFSEHDIHSQLYQLTIEEIKRSKSLCFRSCDGFLTSLVHHEYPTPFRCDMGGYTFRKVSDSEKKSKRGHYDLVVMNPEFIVDNDWIAVTGKDYVEHKQALAKTKSTPLLWACEILYFPKIRKLSKNAISLIKQDALKIKDTLQFKVGKEQKFCKNGSVHVFSSYSETEAPTLRTEVKKLGEDLKVKISFTSAT